MAATIKGPMAALWWGYHQAAELGPFVVTMDAEGNTLSATVRSQEPQRVSQRPLWFEVPRSGPPWRWPVESVNIDGSTCTARLGPLEE